MGAKLALSHLEIAFTFGGNAVASVNLLPLLASALLHPDPAASPSCTDELFVGGVLLPLPVLPAKPASSHAERSSGTSQSVPPALEPETEAEPAEASLLATFAPPTASITSPAPPAAASTGGSKRWTGIFSKKPAEVKDKEKEKEKEKEREKRKDGASGRRQAAHAGGSRGGGARS